jgi:hypothetical protein
MFQTVRMATRLVRVLVVIAVYVSLEGYRSKENKLLANRCRVCTGIFFDLRKNIVSNRVIKFF